MWTAPNKAAVMHVLCFLCRTTATVAISSWNSAALR